MKIILHWYLIQAIIQKTNVNIQSIKQEKLHNWFYFIGNGLDLLLGLIDAPLLTKIIMISWFPDF